MFNLSTGGAILGDRKSCCLEEILDVEMVILQQWGEAGVLVSIV